MTSATGASWGEGAERVSTRAPRAPEPAAVTVHVPDVAETLMTVGLGLLLALLALIMWVMLRFRSLFPTPISIGTSVLAMFVVLMVCGVVAHEALVALVMRAAGGRPRTRFGHLCGVPLPYTTSPGHLFSRSQYIAITLVPNLVIVPFVLAMATWGPGGGNWILPGLVMLGASVADLWMLGHAAAAPGQVQVEVLRDGIALHHQF